MDPKKSADALLKEVWGERDLPVDPVKIARELGILVKSADFPPDISGVIFKEPNNDPVIAFSTRDSIPRRRFTCAHELGHFMSRRGKNEFEYVDYRIHNNRTEDELWANEFAGNLLMPEDKVRAFYKEINDVSVLAYRFGVSADAMRVRLQNLGIFQSDR